MNEGDHLEQHAPAIDLARPGIDWLAVALEFVPFLSIPIVVWLWSEGGSAPLLLVWIPLLLSGLGWCKVGRIGTGCFLAVGRAVMLWAVGIMFIFFVLTRGAFGAIGALSLLAIIAYLVPIASATIVAFASRDWTMEYIDD